MMQYMLYQIALTSIKTCPYDKPFVEKCRCNTEVTATYSRILFRALKICILCVSVLMTPNKKLVHTNINASCMPV